MHDFIKKMLELGFELELSASDIERKAIEKEASELYINHFLKTCNKFTFGETPYIREIVETAKNCDKQNVVAVSKSAAIGFSQSHINPEIEFTFDDFYKKRVSEIRRKLGLNIKVEVLKMPFRTNHFNKGQKVFLEFRTGSQAAKVRGKYRGRNRWVSAWIKWNNDNMDLVNFKEIEIDIEDYRNIMGF